MKIVRCDTGSGPSYGILQDHTVRLIEGHPFQDFEISHEIPLAQTRLLAPCEPSKIIGIGFNYRPHAAELKYDIPEVPLIFLKPPSAIIGPHDEIMLPDMSLQIEYEGEIAVVIGRMAKHVSQDKALDHVFGYTCFNDVTARDLQKKDVQFTRSKSFDTFAPMGPCIETEISPENLTITTTVNNSVRQQASTSDMIRTIPELIQYISAIMTLYPGDLIATGTPAGVGPLTVGDVVSVDIENIGTLTNSVVA